MLVGFIRLSAVGLELISITFLWHRLQLLRVLFFLRFGCWKWCLPMKDYIVCLLPLPFPNSLYDGESSSGTSDRWLSCLKDQINFSTMVNHQPDNSLRSINFLRWLCHSSSFTTFRKKITSFFNIKQGSGAVVLAAVLYWAWKWLRL